MDMKPFLLALAGFATLGGLIGPVEAQRRRDHDSLFEARRSGRIRPLREIEARVLPRMGGADYLGPEFDAATSNYRLKFMRGGSVIWVDVDGRTGAVIGRTGE
jgi:hypothetical protein